jgi:hypothetical protein
MRGIIIAPPTVAIWFFRSISEQWIYWVLRFPKQGEFQELPMGLWPSCTKNRRKKTAFAGGSIDAEND